MKKLFLFLCVISSLFATSIEYDTVYKSYKSKNYKKALEGFKKLVEKNKDDDAAYILGYMHEHGEGCKVDKAEAMKWYKLSASGYYQEDKHSVDKRIKENRDVLYDNIQPIKNKETEETIYQYVHSVFNIKAHKANYLLPLSVRLNGDYDEENNYPRDPNKRNSYRAEVEFQISVKYDFFPNLIGLNEVYTFAYTQHSFWQYYVGDAYFRESNYNPELFVTFPILDKYFKAMRVSVAHQSNGLGGPYERSWNYMTLSTYLQIGTLFTELQVWYRMGDNFNYNPHLIDTMGHGHIKFMLPYKRHMMTALFRNNLRGKGALDTSYSYPLFAKALFLYIKGFVGYGESLIEYAGTNDDPNFPSKDHYVEKIGIGFSLSR